MGVKATVGVCLLILVIGAGVTATIFMTEPVATREGASKETPMLVDVVPVEAGSFRPIIEAMGTVVPEQRVVLEPRVGGQVIELGANFAPGGSVEKGEALVWLEPADFETERVRRRAELRQAQSELQVEVGRQRAAVQEYELAGVTLKGDGKALALREPQLEAARARVEAAEAAVRQAELDLKRTVVRAPFDAQVQSRHVDVGSQVGPGDELGRLVGIETFWVEASVPLEKVPWLDVPAKATARGARVEVRNRTAWPEGQVRIGHVERLIAELEDQTRLARVLVAIEDPLAVESEGAPRMMVGEFVEARIEGRELPSVIRLDRDLVRMNDMVWVMKEEALDIRPVEVAYRDRLHAYISEGLEPGELVVATSLSRVRNGAPLRLREPDPSTTGEGR